MKMLFTSLPLMILMQFTAIAGESYQILTENLVPWSYVEQGKVKGFSVDIVREIQKIVGNRDTIQVTPWARAYSMIQKNPRTILFSTTRSPERENLFKWVGPLMQDSLFFYSYGSKKQSIQTIKDAQNVEMVLVARGYVDAQILQAHGLTNLFYTDSPDQTFRMLIGDRAPLMSYATSILPGALKKYHIDPSKVTRYPPKIFDLNLYIAFSKDTPDSEIKAWQKALDTLKKRGTYAKIAQNYF